MHKRQVRKEWIGRGSFRFLWPCIVSKVWREKNQQDATIRYLLLTSVSKCFGQHYAHLQENKGPVTAFGVLFWFCWMWLVAVVGRCLVECEHYEGFWTETNAVTFVSTCFGHHYAHLQENKDPVTAFGVLFWFCWMWLVAVVGRCLVGCEHYSAHILQRSAPQPLPTTTNKTRTIHQMQ